MQNCQAGVQLLLEATEQATSPAADARSDCGSWFILSSLLLLHLLSGAAVAQAPGPDSAKASQQTIRAPGEVVQVTGVATPVPLLENDRPTALIDVGQRLLHNTFLDYFEEDASIDVRQRGVDGVQADLSILGSSFEQVLVLVNGMRINDAQSGHHNMDVPLGIEALAEIEVLHGAGSTHYGADAMGGAVNLITASPVSTEFRLRAGVGSFGFNEQHISTSVLAGRWSEKLVADRGFSRGFRADRDFRSSSFLSQTRAKTSLGETSLLLAGSDKPFGADQFYGNFDSWERTKGWLVLLQQVIGEGTEAGFGYRRHSDEFVLQREHPEAYENNHVTQSWQAVLRRQRRMRENATLSYGIEADGDQIDSNNLGQHARNRGAGYLSLDFRALRRFSLSLGGREELFSGGGSEFLPRLSGGLWIPSKKLKFSLSLSRGFRLPSYTDLYYRDPANIGNPRLKPESSWTMSGGPELNPQGRISGSIAGFVRRERNGIDYAKRTASEPWQASNSEGLSFAGAEAAVHFRMLDTQRFSLAYTGMYATRAEVNLISRYIFNYPVHQANLGWSGGLRSGLVARTRIGMIQRYRQDAYPLWDFAIARDQGLLRPYLQLSNIANTGYEEIQGVRMPGRSVLVGAELSFVRKSTKH